MTTTPIPPLSADELARLRQEQPDAPLPVGAWLPGSDFDADEVKVHLKHAYTHLSYALDLMDKAPPDHRVETIQGNVNAAANLLFRARRRMGWLEE